jgi:hypothetical protein
MSSIYTCISSLARAVTHSGWSPTGAKNRPGRNSIVWRPSSGCIQLPLGRLEPKIDIVLTTLAGDHMHIEGAHPWN